MKVKVIIEDSGKPSRISEFRLVLLYAGLALKDTTQPFFLFLDCLFTSDKGGGTCFCPCLFVCLVSVSKITQKRVHGFG